MTDTLADVACLVAAFSYALGGMYGRRFKSLPPLQVATGQLTGATLIILPAATLIDRFWDLPVLGLAGCGALAGIVLLCTVLAYILYFRILAVSGATNLMLVTFMLPLNAPFLGSLALGEPIGKAGLAGMVLIGSGLPAIDGRLLGHFRRRQRPRRAPLATHRRSGRHASADRI